MFDRRVSDRAENWKNSFSARSIYMYIVAEKQYILRSCHVSQAQPNKKNPGFTHILCVLKYMQTDVVRILNFKSIFKN